MAATWITGTETWRQYAQGVWTLSALPIPKWWVSILIPYGMLSSALHFLRQLGTPAVGEALPIGGAGLHDLVGRAVGRNGAAAVPVRPRRADLRRLRGAQRDRRIRVVRRVGLRPVRQQHLFDRDARGAVGGAAVHRHGRDPVPVRRDGRAVRFARPADRAHSRPPIRAVHRALGDPGGAVGRRHGGGGPARPLAVSHHAQARLRHPVLGRHDPGRREPRSDHSAERARGHHRDARRRVGRQDAGRRHPARAAAHRHVPGLRADPGPHHAVARARRRASTRPTASRRQRR